MKQILFLLLCCIMLFAKCVNDGKSRHIAMYNNSGRTVCYYESKEYNYPDTLLPYNQPFMLPIDKQRSWNFCDLGCNEDHLFALLPADTLSIFFFDPDTLAKYEWRTIRQEYKILVRYDFSQKDLQLLRWSIYYPPTKEMKYMKMYPPYGIE